MKDLKDCEEEGVTVFVPIPSTGNPHKWYSVPMPEFYTDMFFYDSVRDVYVCPAGETRGFWNCIHKDRPERGRVYKTVCCAVCGFRSKCTRNKRGRIIFRGEFEEAVERLRSRLDTSEGKEKLRLRRELAEHPFGTMKRAFNQGYLLLKGLRKGRGEVGFTMLAYNIRRGHQYSWSEHTNCFN
jgi:hypothetical protein